MAINYKLYGNGPSHVIVMHDWLCDSSSYDAMLPYLDKSRFTYAFADLRGYGKSKNLPAQFTVEEASSDILTLADSLKWSNFYLVGHSMSGMIAQWIALTAPERIKNVVAITPVPASGSPAPENIYQFLEDAANGNDANAAFMINFMTASRYDKSPFMTFKVQKWRETSTPEARKGYLKMFSQTNFADKAKGLKTAFLIIVGGCDMEGNQEPAMRKTFQELYPNAQIAVIQDAGHYPMQETPVLLACMIERFLA